MSTYQKLSVDDVTTLRKHRNSSLIGMGAMAMIFYLLIPGFIYYILHVSFSYSWIYLLISTILLVLVGWLANRSYKSCAEDLKNGLKVTGTAKLDRKHKISLRGDSKCWFYFEMDGQQQIEVPAHQFGQFEEGDEIYVEFTKFSKKLLHLGSKVS